MSKTTTCQRSRRHISLLPSLLTSAALFSGFYAIVAAMKQHYIAAAVAIIIALFFDGLDGRVARLTQTQSEFGAQLDSLSDMVSFGVAPALILYTWSLWGLGKPGWLAAFLYTICTALRLARFNTDHESEPRFFCGLSTTAAAGWTASLVWACANSHIHGPQIDWLIAIFALFVAMLKISTIPYYSFKDINLKRQVPFVIIVLVILVLTFIAFDPADVLLGIGTVYCLHGPVFYLWRRFKRRSH